MGDVDYFKKEAKRQLLMTAATWSAIVLISLMVGAFILLFWARNISFGGRAQNSTSGF